MENNQFDIAIIGSGLSSYSAIKYLIYKKIHLKKNICIVTGKYNLNEINLTKSQLGYLKKSHKVIYENRSFNEINKESFAYFIKNNLNLISLTSLGGLSKYWGGGFFPSKTSSKNKKINLLIKKQFKNKASEIKDYFKIKYNKNKDFKSINCKFLVSNDSQNQILNPGEEIKKICDINDIKIIDDSVRDFKLGNKFNPLTIYLLNKKVIKTKYILLAAGAIGTPKILSKSKILKEKNLTIKDHAMYRIPLFRPLEIIKFLIKIFFKKKKRKINTLSSLKQAFKVKVGKRTFFLGLYSLSTEKIKLQFLLRILIDYEIIIFSQIYVGNEEKEYSCKISIDSKEKKSKVKNKNHLRLKEWKSVLTFFFKNNMIPIPYIYKLPFGSSYHYFGTLISSINQINAIQKDNKRIFIVDNCVLNNIGCEPSSYKVIENTFYETEKFLNMVKLRND